MSSYTITFTASSLLIGVLSRFKNYNICLSCSSYEIPYLYREYSELVDWSGRAIRANKHGAIDSRLPPILVRLGIDEEEWHKAMQPKGTHQFSRAMGKCDAMRCDAMRAQAKRLAIKWIKGIGISIKLFPT